MARNCHTLLALFAAGAAAVFSFSQTAQAQILVQGGVLRSRVFVIDPQPPSNSASHVIQSFPIYTTLIARVDASRSITTFDMEVNGNSADWLISTNHRLTGFRGDVSSSGTNIRITPSIDSLFSVDSWFNYNHPPSLLGNAFLSTRIFRIGPSGELLGVVFITGDSDGTHGLGPPVGTLTANGSYNLLAGLRYQIDFQFITNNYSVPPPDATWLGNGQIHITINPVPEPTALLLMSMVMLPALHHRVGRRGKRALRLGISKCV